MNKRTVPLIAASLSLACCPAACGNKEAEEAARKAEQVAAEAKVKARRPPRKPRR